MGLLDSGSRLQFASGMVRDTAEGKVNYLLTRDGPMLKRWAAHLTEGAKKYAPRNWMKANSVEELERMKESATRHFEQWLAGETDEDHAAAVFCNIDFAEYTKGQIALPNAALGPNGRVEWCVVCGKEFTDLARFNGKIVDVSRMLGEGGWETGMAHRVCAYEQQGWKNREQ